MPPDEFELVFNVPETPPDTRVSVARRPASIPYTLGGFTERPVQQGRWLLHGLSIGGEEQLLSDTGVPLEVFDAGGDFAIFAFAKVCVGDVVALVVSHSFDLPRGARMKMLAFR